jgi:hypothetical protein
MRTKTFMPGFKNSQKMRIILRKGEVSVGLYLTVRDIVFNFATTSAGEAAYEALYYLAQMRRLEKNAGGLVPTGFCRKCKEFDVQLDVV